MTASVLLGVADQVTAYELRALLGEIEDLTVADVADSTSRLQHLVLQRDPDVVLVHEQLGPDPVLTTVRDLVLRRPATAVVLLVEQATPEVFQTAADAGARVLVYPATLEEVGTRLRAAVDWSAQMRRVLRSETPAAAEGGGRGRVLAVAGAKGGVGTSTVACHLALAALRAAPGRSVCLVELDLEKGDLGHLLGISHRLDISDLAKIATDLGPQTLGSSVHRHESGLAVLLAPARIEDVGAVGDREVRLILAALRSTFDLVLVDCGAHVTPVSAAAVETADELVLVATPDVLALRGVHRAVDTWSRLGVRTTEQVRLLLNRTSRSSELQPEAAARLVPTTALRTTLPASFKHLEPGLNHRSPGEVRQKGWWKAVDGLAVELGLAPEGRAPGARADGADGGRRRRVRGDSGQAALEFVGVFPLALLLAVVVWQVALWAAMAGLSGHAASEGARAAAVDTLSAGELRQEAVGSVPSWFRGGMDVSRAGDQVVVRAELPVLFPGVGTDGLVFTSRAVVVEG